MVPHNSMWIGLLKSNKRCITEISSYFTALIQGLTNFNKWHSNAWIIVHTADPCQIFYLQKPHNKGLFVVKHFTKTIYLWQTPLPASVFILDPIYLNKTILLINCQTRCHRRLTKPRLDWQQHKKAGKADWGPTVRSDQCWWGVIFWFFIVTGKHQFFSVIFLHLFTCKWIPRWKPKYYRNLKQNSDMTKMAAQSITLWPPPMFTIKYLPRSVRILIVSTMITKCDAYLSMTTV